MYLKDKSSMCRDEAESVSKMHASICDLQDRRTLFLVFLRAIAGLYERF